MKSIDLYLKRKAQATSRPTRIGLSVVIVINRHEECGDPLIICFRLVLFRALVGQLCTNLRHTLLCVASYFVTYFHPQLCLSNDTLYIYC